MTRFYIQSGVRRALASLHTGRKTIRATLYREGQPPKRCRVKLSDLYVPAAKAIVQRDARFLRITPPIHTPIEIEPIGQRGQTRAIPLAQVRLQ